MTELAKIPESQMPSYPGLNPTNANLWRDFLKVYESFWASYDYNVRVGQGLRVPASYDQSLAAMWKALTQKRIDVVARRPGQTWIIEVDESPGARTLGQTLLYQHLGPQYIEVQGKLVLALVCRHIGYDMFATFKRHDVAIFKFPLGRPPVVPPAFPPPLAGVEHSSTYFK